MRSSQLKLHSNFCLLCHVLFLSCASLLLNASLGVNSIEVDEKLIYSEASRRPVLLYKGHFCERKGSQVDSDPYSWSHSALKLQFSVAFTIDWGLTSYLLAEVPYYHAGTCIQKSLNKLCVYSGNHTEHLFGHGRNTLQCSVRLAHIIPYLTGSCFRLEVYFWLNSACKRKLSMYSPFQKWFK